MTQHRTTVLPHPSDTQLPHPHPPVRSGSLSGPARLSGWGAAAIVAVIFAAAVFLRLAGTPLGEEVALLAATGLIAGFVVAVGNGRASARVLAKKVGKLAEDK